MHLDRHTGRGASARGPAIVHPAPANRHPVGGPRRSVFHIIVAVWGARYRDQMVDICFPSLLAPGNLPALLAFGDVKIIIVTCEDDERALRAERIVRKLGGLAELVFLNFNPQRHASSHAALSAAHRMAIELTLQERARGIILTPDLICSENTLFSVGRAAAAGCKAVLVSGLRLQTETAIPSLTELGLPASDGGHPILAPRNLVAFALQHLHPEVLRSDTESDEFNPYPTFLIWPLQGKGLLQRSFHLHPLMIDFAAIDRKALDTLQYSSIDGAFLGSAFPDHDGIHVEQDSDDGLVFSFSPADERAETRAKNRFSTALLSNAAYRFNVDARHRHLFTKPIRLHTGELDVEWCRVEAESAKIARHARTLRGELGALLPISETTRHDLAMLPTRLSFGLREMAFRCRHRVSFTLWDWIAHVFRLKHRVLYLVRSRHTRLSFLAREMRLRLGVRINPSAIYRNSYLVSVIREHQYRIRHRFSFFIREMQFRIAHRVSFFMRERRYRLGHRLGRERAL